MRRWQRLWQDPVFVNGLSRLTCPEWFFAQAKQGRMDMRRKIALGVVKGNVLPRMIAKRKS
jgi:hypothetical protein